MRCPNCGRTDVPEGSKFCIECGGSLEPRRASRPQASQASLIIDYDDAVPVRRSHRRIAPLAGVGVLVVGIGAWVTLSSLGAAPRAATPPQAASTTPPAPVDSMVPVSPPPDPAPSRSPAPPSSPSSTTRARPPAPRVDAGTLSLSSVPWGRVSVDGHPVGTTPVLDLTIGAGVHRLRVEHPGFDTYEQTIMVTAGQRLLITDITLRRH